METFPYQCQGESRSRRATQIQRSTAPRISGQMARSRFPTCKRYSILQSHCCAHEQATWVPHPWILANSAPRLKNFLIKGPSLDLVTDETLAARGDDMAAPTIADLMDEADNAGNQAAHHRNGQSKDAWRGAGPPPDVEAQMSIPPAWKVSLETTRQLLSGLTVRRWTA